MSQSERKRRPQLSRTRPIREWSTLFGQGQRAETPGPANDDFPNKAGKSEPQPDGDQQTRREQQADSAQSDSARPADRQNQPGFEDAVARSVELGYSVVDEYVRRGQEAARRMRAGTYGTTALVQDARDVTERMIRGASDVVGAWGELLELTSIDNDQPGTTATSDGGPHSVFSSVSPAAGDEAPQTQAGPWRVRVRVDSMRAVEVTVDVDSPLDDQELTVHALRAVNGSDTRIEDVGFELDCEGMPTIVVRVAADHPSGVYRGSLVDGRSGCNAGTLTVSVSDA